MSEDKDAFAKAAGLRWTRAIREQIEPLLGDKSLLAVRIYFSFDAGTGPRSGEITMAISLGVHAMLQATIEERLAGRVPLIHRRVTQLEPRRKS